MICVLESVQKKFFWMVLEDQEKFWLDDFFGGMLEVIQCCVIYCIYGDKVLEIIESFKKNFVIVVFVVLKRLKVKEEEWWEVQQGFNKIWWEQYEKVYFKFFDYQVVNFKQNDIKVLCFKSLFNEIESVYDEYQEQYLEGCSVFFSELYFIFVYED